MKEKYAYRQSLIASTVQSRNHEMPTDANRPARHTETAPVSVLGCLGLSVCICCFLLVSHDPQRGLGGVLGMSGGYLGVSKWSSWKSEAIGCVWGDLVSQALQYRAKTLFWYSPERYDFFSSDYTEPSKYIYKLNKNGWVLPFLCFLVPVRTI